MNQGICLLSTAALRAEDSEQSEMVSQLLFGDMFLITEVFGSWMKIKLVFDDYEGWIDKKQCTLLDDREFEHLASNNKSVSTDLVQLIYHKSRNIYFPILIGSTLPGIENQNFTIAGNEFFFEGEYSTGNVNTLGKTITDVAMQYYNTPYLWGGRCPFGIDCSGFTQMVMKICGIAIHRDTSQQVLQGKIVDFISEAQAGDLAFFENDENKVVHTGIILGNQKIIHASGQVRIDDIDHHGIYNGKSSSYTHKLKIIRRFV